MRELHLERAHAQLDLALLDAADTLGEPVDDPRLLHRLHAWKAAHGYAPTAPCPQLMHVDVHGKMDRAESMAIDVGMLPMEEEGCLAVAQAGGAWGALHRPARRRRYPII